MPGITLSSPRLTQWRRLRPLGSRRTPTSAHTIRRVHRESCSCQCGLTSEFPKFTTTAGAAHTFAALLEALTSIHQRHLGKAHGDVMLPAIRAVAESGQPPLGRYQAVRALGSLSSRDDVYSFLIACPLRPERLVRLRTIESLRFGKVLTERQRSLIWSPGSV